MIRCRECGSAEPEGALFCSECGNPLVESKNQSTAQLPFSDNLTDPLPPSLLGQDLGAITDARKVMFVIPSSGRRVTLELLEEIRVGRADPTKSVIPELDLTDDKGAEFGVSRMHASIQISNRGVVLVDLGSTNGTLLNNYRLPPDLPYPLHNGDEIRFGRLLVHVFFE
ncbi:MAG: FHA domain-containing protein [Chloroflexi bacterium]|nr:FHA domain-containing protein [Chloroflexota bacterium]MCI0576772.1 FHA domain-containing protein [Chloroflexota bacterium]MCI0645966.1 FHA domain-containing protein [Chloroflexota bacterium]MCI0731478.1 FHA domain-containing protein [Chloroflexota bacterium]